MACAHELLIIGLDGAGNRIAIAIGMHLANVVERDLPTASRYLPVTQSGSLSKRMRTETILTFVRALLHPCNTLIPNRIFTLSKAFSFFYIG